MEFTKKLAILLFCILVVACSRVTEENYDRIENGMEETAVIKILGQPDDSSVMKLGTLSGKSSTWDDGKARISIQFLNDKVTLKTFAASEMQTP